MGRPSLTRRPTRSSPDEDPKSIEFPRRFPRLGSQFQLKTVPSLGSPPSQRPAPVPISNELPYRTQDEVAYGVLEEYGSLDLYPSSSSPSTTGTKRRGEELSQGYESVHHPNNPQNDDLLLATVQPLLLQYETTTEDDTDALWIRDVMKWHQGVASPTTAPTTTLGRRTKSRWSRNGISQPPTLFPPPPKSYHPITTKRMKLDPCVEHEAILAYTGSAQELLADWTHGKACSARRRRRRGPVMDRSKLASWREYCQLPITTVGDYRQQQHHDDREDDERVDSTDNMEDVWKAVGACGKALLAQPVSQLRLAEIVSFVDRASRLLPPERVFREMDVPTEIASTMWMLLDRADAARKVQAKLVDMWRQEGVEVDALRKQMEGTASVCILECSDEMKRQIETMAEWESRVDTILSAGEGEATADPNGLETLEALQVEARIGGFRSKGVVALESRLDKAYQLRSRINDWREANKQDRFDTIKFVASLSREVIKINFLFPEALELLTFYREAESWVERADIAIRSRIALPEIRRLIRRGEEMPLDLSDYLEKLKVRAFSGEDWLERFQDIVPCMIDQDGEVAALECLELVREVLEKGGHCSLHELASEGSRIPVDVDCVKLLQVELDARIWTAKARKWLPTDASSDGDLVGRKGKLEDLQEHMEKAEALRDRLALKSSDRDSWILPGEHELRTIVVAAEDWYDENEEILEGDNRRVKGRVKVSLRNLRSIATAAESMFVSLGSSGIKISKILSQAEAWYKTYAPLLERCWLGGDSEASSCVELLEIDDAVRAARDDLAVDLDEAMQLKALGQRINRWFEDSAIASGTKRQGRSRRTTFSIKQLEELIRDASALPVDTEEMKQNLLHQLNKVKAWQAKASLELEDIMTGLNSLRCVVTETYGPPAEFSRPAATQNEADGESRSGGDDASMSSENDGIGGGSLEEKKVPDDVVVVEAMSIAGSDNDIAAFDRFGSGDLTKVDALIKQFHSEAQEFCIDTPEGAMGQELEEMWRWLLRSLKYIDSHRDVFDKRFFGAFDRFLAEGGDICVLRTTDTDDLAIRLREACGSLVEDQVQRLNILRVERDRYTSWCGIAKRLLSEEKRLAFEKLVELAEESRSYPIACELIKRVQALEKSARSWIRSTSERLSSGGKLSFQEAKVLLDEGDRLGLQSSELISLRNGVKAARGWANRVKRCKPEQGSMRASEIKALLDEHDALIVAMPDEAIKLQGAMRSYCLCRRPYEGFMIGCDACDEWYHGPCIGVSESKAGRVEKYVCLRCSVAKGFEISATSLVALIRKWTDMKDRRKVRQAEAAKHQRKVRKEMKDLEVLMEEQAILKHKLAEIKAVSHRVPVQTPSSMIGPFLVPFAPMLQEKMPQTLLSLQSMVVDADHAATTTLDVPGSSIEAVSDSSAATAGDVATVDSVECRLETVEHAIKGCEGRLLQLEDITIQRRNEEELEDARETDLLVFFLRARTHVLVPPTLEAAMESRPHADGSLSPPMVKIVDDAENRGLTEFKDVEEALNCFKCMAWWLRAMQTLSKHPNMDDISSLVQSASNLRLGDEKGLRMLKSLLSRGKIWTAKVSKALAPAPFESRPFSLETLKDLASIGDDIPLCMPIESRLLTVIEDRGSRHCVCGGPSDGRFMLSCDGCDKWFHGHCVRVAKEESDNMHEWKCPACSGTHFDLTALDLDKFDENFDSDVEDVEGDDEGSAVSRPDLWPPFGLSGSEKAKAALGTICSNIPDSVVAPIVDTGVEARCESEQQQGAVTSVANDPVAPVAAMPIASLQQQQHHHHHHNQHPHSVVHPHHHHHHLVPQYMGYLMSHSDPAAANSLHQAAPPYGGSTPPYSYYPSQFNHF